MTATIISDDEAVRADGYNHRCNSDENARYQDHYFYFHVHLRFLYRTAARSMDPHLDLGDVRLRKPEVGINV